MLNRRYRVVLSLLALTLLAACGDDDSNNGNLWAEPDPAFKAARDACTFTAGAAVTETLGISEGAVKALLFRATHALKARLKAHM